MEGPRKAFAAVLAAETRYALTLLPVVLEVYAGTCHFSQGAARIGFFVVAFDLNKIFGVFELAEALKVVFVPQSVCVDVCAGPAVDPSCKSSRHPAPRFGLPLYT